MGINLEGWVSSYQGGDIVVGFGGVFAWAYLSGVCMFQVQGIVRVWVVFIVGWYSFQVGCVEWFLSFVCRRGFRRGCF